MICEKDIEALSREICPPDREAMEKAAARQEELAKVPGSLGRLEDISIRMAGIT
ncbi:MAG: nicotinate-nucleotide--dimethylbenzimidazole phosphoribosyltransferase, partial [Hornefia butyriciproducens]|nr:nicotinate-nucleotide--dimethylbenzimidazole phosphoribosyltransferase [Hornefia butyriciproducens]